MRPLHDFVLIQKVEKKASSGGILLSSTTQEEVVEGVVVAMGPGLYTSEGALVPLSDMLAVSDKVLFKPYSGTSMPEGLVLVSFREILAVL